MSFISSVPTGTVFDYAGSAAPTGWILCYGQEISRTDYVDLFATIGTTFGTGNGSTTFNLPDCRGRVGAGKDDMGGSAASRLTNSGSGITGTTLGANGGAEKVTLTSGQSGFPGASGNFTSGNNSASHSHTFPVYTNPLGGGGRAESDSNGTGLVGNVTTSTESASHTHTTAVSFASANAASAHSNTQPTIVFNKIIKT